jgi:hypothetical protein
VQETYLGVTVQASLDIKGDYLKNNQSKKGWDKAVTKQAQDSNLSSTTLPKMSVQDEMFLIKTK